MDSCHELLTIEEARKLLRVGRNVMYELVKEGVPYIKLGKQIRIPREELQQWLKDQVQVKYERSAI